MINDFKKNIALLHEFVLGFLVGLMFVKKLSKKNTYQVFEKINFLPKLLRGYYFSYCHLNHWNIRQYEIYFLDLALHQRNSHVKLKIKNYTNRENKMTTQECSSCERNLYSFSINQQDIVMVDAQINWINKILIFNSSFRKFCVFRPFHEFNLCKTFNAQIK